MRILRDFRLFKSFFINDDLKMFILQFAMPAWWASDYNALYKTGSAGLEVLMLLILFSFLFFIPGGKTAAQHMSE